MKQFQMKWLFLTYACLFFIQISPTVVSLNFRQYPEIILKSKPSGPQVSTASLGINGSKSGSSGHSLGEGGSTASLGINGPQTNTASLGEVNSQEAIAELNDPKRMLKNKLRHLQTLNIVNGINASYAGYVAATDYNGRVTFPRQQTSNMVYLLITPKISPIIMLGNTIHHWEIEENTPARMIKAEKVHGPNEKSWYWNLEEVSLPKDNVIPIQAIVIFAFPENIFVPLGASLAGNDNNLLLPTLYVKKNTNRLARALYLINISQFFDSLSKKYKVEPKKYLGIRVYPSK